MEWEMRFDASAKDGIRFFLFFCRCSSAYTDPGSRNVSAGKLERTAFVNVLLRLIDRGQYSKNEHLSETVAAATLILSYVEPSLFFHFLASRFHTALETSVKRCCGLVVVGLR